MIIFVYGIAILALVMVIALLFGEFGRSRVD
jgi:hypothetical protein